MRLRTTYTTRRMMTSAERAEVEAVKPSHLTAHLSQVIGSGCVARIYDGHEEPIVEVRGHPSLMTAFRRAVQLLPAREGLVAKVARGVRR